jgi:hypothetical protein
MTDSTPHDDEEIRNEHAHALRSTQPRRDILPPAHYLEREGEGKQ